jgi:poly-beta-hydroxyalkanoate depolymerase
MVPLTEGRFDLEDYVDYVIEMHEFQSPQGRPQGVVQ